MSTGCRMKVALSIILFVLCLDETHAWWNSWEKWSPCSAQCGGGSRTRDRYSKFVHDHDSQTEDCNTWCYNGGRYSGYCHCSPGTSGTCCKFYRLNHSATGPHIDFANCRRVTTSGQRSRCTQCNDPFYSGGWGKGCLQCSSIDHCSERYCSSRTDQKCRKCDDDKTFFKRINGDTHCGRMCSWNNHFCWPGTCGDELTANCVCASNFTAVKSGTQTTCQPENYPTFETCTMTVNGDGMKRYSPTVGPDTSCQYQADFYGKLKAEQVDFSILAEYSINTARFPTRPAYIEEERFGVTDVTAKIIKRTISGTETNVKTDQLLVNNMVRANATYSTKNTIVVPKTHQNLMNGQSLCLEFETKGGGYLKAKDLSSPFHHLSTVPYRKKTRKRTLCYHFDNDAPRHCFETGHCQQPPLKLNTRISGDGKMNVDFTGWHDTIPVGGTKVHASGIGKYQLTVNEVSGTALLKVDGTPVISKTYFPNETSWSFSLPPNKTRLYCLKLEVVDVAENSRQARRFFLVDNSTYIQSRPDHPFYVTSAAKDVKYEWQTHHNDICVSWKGHFFNQFYLDNPLLSPIEPDPFGQITGVYEQTTGKLPLSGTQDLYGIVNFTVAWQVDGGNVSEKVTVKNFSKETFCKHFSVEDGQTYTFTTTAVDIAGHTLSENRSVHIDRTVPHINNIWLMKDDHKRLFVHNSTDLANMEVYFEALDPHSGILNVDWAFHVQDTGQLLVQKSIGATNLENQTSCLPRERFCYCPSVGSCQLFNYSFTLNSLVKLDKAAGDHNRNYVLSIKATNNAHLSNFEHVDVLVDDSPPEPGVVFEGPVDGPDIDYTNDDKFTAHWHGFIDHESGIKMYLVGLAQTCLSSQELYEWEPAVSKLRPDTLFKEVFDTQVQLKANFSGHRYVTVVALNNAMQPSEAVCSDGITVDTTPPEFVNVSVQNGRWDETVGCYDGNAWLFKAEMTKVRLHNITSCFQTCRNSSDSESIAAAIPSIAQTKNDTDVSDFICQKIPLYSQETFIYVPTDRLSITWDIREDLSQMRDFYVGLGRDRSEANNPLILGFTSTGKKPYYKKQHTGIGSDAVFYIFLKAENKAGLSSVTTLGPVIIDQTPPLYRDVPQVITTKTHFVIGWKNTTFYDVEQPGSINEIYFQFGHGSEKVTPVLKWSSRHSAACPRFSGGCISYPLQKIQKHDTEQGLLFHVTLYVYNNAGHFTRVTTDEFKVPSKYTPGHAIISDIDPGCIDCKNDVDIHVTPETMCFTWRGFNHHENVSLEYGIGSQQGKTDVLSYQTISAENKSVCLTSNKLHFNKRYFAVVRARCSGGNTISISNGVLILDETELSNRLSVFTGPGCSAQDRIQHKEYNRTNVSGNMTVSLRYTLPIIIGRPYTICFQGLGLIEAIPLNGFGHVAHASRANKTTDGISILVWPTDETEASVQVQLLHNGTLASVDMMSCMNSVHFQSQTDSISTYWHMTENDDSYQLMYEVALVKDNCSSGREHVSGCIDFVRKFQNPRAISNHEFTGLNLRSNESYRTAVRPCINNRCLNFSLSDPVTIDDIPPQGRTSSAVITGFNGDCFNVTYTWDSFESISRMMFYQWTITDKDSLGHLLTPWHTVTSQRNSIEITKCITLPVHAHKEMTACVRGFSEAGLMGTLCTPLLSDEHVKNYDNNVVYDIDSSSAAWGQIQHLLHSGNVGKLITQIHTSEMDFADRNSSIAGFVLYGTERTIDWFLTTKRIAPLKCQGNTHCLATQSSITGYVEFSRNNLKPNEPLYICAFSHKQNVSRELFTEVLPEINSCSNGFILDDSPPSAGTVHVSNKNGYLTDSSSITFSWDGFHDASNASALGYISPIRQYSYQIGSKAYSDDIRRSTPVNHASATIARGLTVLDGTVVFVSVTATDHVGHSTVSVSRGYVVDTTGQAAGTARIDDNHGRQMFLSRPKFTLILQGFHDPESGIKHYIVSIGSEPHRSDTLQETAFDTDQPVIHLGSNVLDGHVYYLSVKAINRAGITSTCVSQSLIFDQTEPTGGLAVDGSSYRNNDLDFETETNHLGGRWSGFDDPHSGIHHYQAGLGSAPLRDDIQAMVDVGLNKDIYWNSSFEHGVRYFLTVEACNGAGLCRRISSDGILIDNSPPIPGLVKIGAAGESHRYQPHSMSVHIEWIGFEDPHSGIDHFDACVGTAPFQCDIVPQFNCLLQSSIVKTNLSLPVNTNLYATVIATNKAQLTTKRSSDWFRVDTTAPVLVSRPFYSNVDMLGGGQVQWERSIIRLAWEFRDDDCPVDKHLISMVTHHEGHTPIEHVVMGAENKLTVNLEAKDALKNGDKYRVIVTACNVAGLCTSAESDDLLIDSTPSHLGGFKPPMTWENSKDVHGNTVASVNLTWYGFADPESGIKAYYLTASRTYSGSELSNGMVSIGHNISNSELTGTINLSEPLGNDEKIVLSIWAQNHAGLQSPIGRITVTVISATTKGTVGTQSGFLDIEKHSCDVHFCNKDCTCAVVGRPCTTDTSNITCTEVDDASPEGTFPDIQVYGGSVGYRSNMTASSTCLAGHWTLSSTANNTLERFEWSMGRSDGEPGYGIYDLQQDIPWKDIGLRQAVVHCLDKDHDLKHGLNCIIYVKAWFDSNTYKLYESPAILIDHTPPHVRRGGAVKDTVAACTQDVDFISTDTSITACWDNVFTDQQTSIVYYLVCLGTKPEASDIHQWKNVGLSTRFKMTNLRQLTHGNRFYFTVTAFNAVGLHTTLSSDGFMIDHEPPVPGVVFNTARHRDVSYQSSTTSLALSWHGFVDHHSGIKAHYAAVFPCNANSTDIEYTNVGLQNTFVSVNTTLDDGESYCGAVKAVDAAGHTSIVVKSKSLVIDATTPIAFSCRAFSVISLNDTQQPRLNVFLRKDDYYLIHGTIENATEETRVRSTIDKFHATFPLTLNHDATGTFEYRFLSPYQGNHSILITVDSETAVLPTSSLEVFHCDSMTEDSTARVTVQQLGPQRIAVTVPMVDRDSGLRQIYIGVGSSPHGFQVRPLTPVRGAHNVEVYTDVPHGTPLYVTAIAENNAGLRRSLVSDGLVFDRTPPTVTHVEVSLDSDTHSTSNEAAFIVSAKWEAKDVESGLKACTCCFGGSPGSSDISPCAVSPNTSSCSSEALNLPHGTSVYVTVRCVNRVELATETVSSPLVVSYETPVSSMASARLIPVDLYPSSSLNGGYAQSNSSCLQLTWLGIVDESGIQSYEYRLLSNTSTILDWTNAELRTFATMEHLQLTDGATYTAEVRAMNSGFKYSTPLRTHVLVDSRIPALTNRPLLVTVSGSRMTLDWDKVFSLNNLLDRQFSLTVGSHPGYSDVADIRSTADTQHLLDLPKSTFQNPDLHELFITIKCLYSTGLSNTYKTSYKLN